MFLSVLPAGVINDDSVNDNGLSNSAIAKDPEYPPVSFLARNVEHYMLNALYAIARPSV